MTVPPQHLPSHDKHGARNQEPDKPEGRRIKGARCWAPLSKPVDVISVQFISKLACFIIPIRADGEGTVYFAI